MKEMLKMIGYKERTVYAGEQAKVYFNLHKKCFSVQQNGLVVLHADDVYMQDVTFKINEAGRQRVLQERRKNVHAFVHGEFICSGEELRGIQEGWRQAYYNPYQTETFVDKETGEPIISAKRFLLTQGKMFYRN